MESAVERKTDEKGHASAMDRDFRDTPSAALAFERPDGTVRLLEPEFPTLGEYPEGSWMLLENGTVMASPEFTYVVTAREFSMEALLLHGMEYCGKYIYPGDPKKGLLLFGYPLSPYKDLVDYIERARTAGMRGADTARAAVRYVSGGSASPLESAFLVFFCGPESIGGLGMPKPYVNARACLDKAAEDFYGNSRAECSFIWKHPGLCIDMDDVWFRGSYLQKSGLDKKAEALHIQHVPYMVIGTEEFCDFDAIFDVARMVAKRMGVRIDPSCRQSGSRQRKLHRSLVEGTRELRHSLIPPKELDGKPRFSIYDES